MTSLKCVENPISSAVVITYGELGVAAAAAKEEENSIHRRKAELMAIRLKIVYVRKCGGNMKYISRGFGNGTKERRW